MRILVTGANGFIGKNLVIRLKEIGADVLTYTRGNTPAQLSNSLADADAVIHLAGENRPLDPLDFEVGNIGLTKLLCDAVQRSGRKIPIIFASSSQAGLDSPYGLSKLAAERLIEGFVASHGGSAVIYRLPGVFGKWCEPNYNSVIATFCHNISRDLPIYIRDPDAEIQLVYIDDVVTELIDATQRGPIGLAMRSVAPEYTSTLGVIAGHIKGFRNSRESLMSGRVGNGFVRALYSTYISYLPPEKIVYDLPTYKDDRGLFAEVLKTPDCGQFSFFTSASGLTRGGHYHHSKTEKFLVIRGNAHFRFRHIISGDTFDLHVSGERPQVVETIPGWIHDITNVGDDQMLVMLWANEVFDRMHPDTITCEVGI